MSCFSELTYAIYADGELPLEELRQVEAHLAVCPRCRELAEALRRENRFLTEMLQEAEALPTVAAAVPAPAPATGFRVLDLVWTTAVVLVAAAGANVVMNWFTRVETVPGLGWLNPLSFGVQVKLFFDSLFYFINQGAAMLASLTTTIVAFALVLAVLGAGWLLWRRRQTPAALVASLLLIFLVALPASALEPRKFKRGAVAVQAGETVDDTLLVHAEKVLIDGTVTGDLIAFAEGVEINGTVKGDLVCFAGEVRIKGMVEGNVFAFTGGLDLPGRVGRGLYTFSGGTNIRPGAQVDGDLTAFSGGVNVEGAVARDLTAFAGGTSVSGTIGRNLRARTDELSLTSSARVGGNLTAYVKKSESAKINPGATVAGEMQIHVREPVSAYTSPGFYLRQALGLTIVFFIGLLLFWLYPRLRPGRAEGASGLLRAAGVGFLALVAPPAAALVVGVVLVGIGMLADVLLISLLFPLLVVVLWLIAVYLAKVFVGYLIGQALLPSPEQPARFAVPLLVGLVIVYVAVNLPYAGPVLRFLVWLLGLGVAVLQLYRRWQRPQPIV